ncbi:hypothetical protein TrVE_jg10051 [Triparma verrucosa]|uniref:Photolyase/cryptochrome alpha/beta domain-containing protein n=1 Tax=Triparma verrucosa TaxID=1606542 RepID=A0A9W6Z7R5_9STRA|nr:hypothetical protein TrVE_jg10051 [Triparma verrucosa]
MLLPPSISDHLAQNCSQLLLERIRCNNPSKSPNFQPGKFILHLPLISLRSSSQNPTFAVASKLASSLNLPLITVFCICCPSTLTSSFLTPRRLALTLEAISSSSLSYEDHGSKTYILCSGVNSSLPYGSQVGSILNLLFKSSICVTDEPFVDPYVDFVNRLERGSNVPILRVDGSTIVPPNSILKHTNDKVGKAWQWQEKTKKFREERVAAAVRGDFDGVKVEGEEEFEIQLPPMWMEERGVIVMTGEDLRNVKPTIKAYVTQQVRTNLNCTSPPVAPQTNGTTSAGLARWRSFVSSSSSGLKSYAKNRNDPTRPHTVSRMSCYLNLGITPIFTCVHDVLLHKNAKMADEILKFREHSYAYCFQNPSHVLSPSLPPFAVRYFGDRLSHSARNRVRVEAPAGGQDQAGSGSPPSSSSDILSNLSSKLSTSSSSCPTWNAMQSYLVETGELHNNVRMTWGKQAVSWLTRDLTIEESLRVMTMLNDKYALDGFSPPSYLGILWCFGVGDKPGRDGGVAEKRSGSYKVGPAGFDVAKKRLVEGNEGGGGGKRQTVTEFFKPQKKMKAIIG